MARKKVADQSRSNPGNKQCEKTALFEQGKGGYNNYRIPSLIVSKKGTLLTFCEGREAGVESKYETMTFEVFSMEELLECIQNSEFAQY